MPDPVTTASLKTLFPPEDGMEALATLFLPGTAKASPTWIDVADAFELVNPERIRRLSDAATIYVTPGIFLGLLTAGEDHAHHVFVTYSFQLKRCLGAFQRAVSDDQREAICALVAQAEQREFDVFDRGEEIWLGQIGLRSGRAKPRR